MIVTLFITILIESVVVVVYSLWRRKPVYSILFTSVWINLITQSLLWIGLNLYFKQYLVTLIVAEILIWVTESILLCCIPANHLRLKESILLSLSLNLMSFTPGWFLPV